MQIMQYQSKSGRTRMRWGKRHCHYVIGHRTRGNFKSTRHHTQNDLRIVCLTAAQITPKHLRKIGRN